MPKYEITTSRGNVFKINADNILSPEDMEEISLGFESNEYRPTESSEIRNYTTEELRSIVEKDLDTDFNLGQFTTGIGKGAMELLRLGTVATEELGGAIMGGDFKKVGSTGLESIARASFDLVDMGEAIAGRAGDLLESDREAIINRRVERMRQDQLDQQKRSRGLLFTPEETLPAATEVGSFVLDPTNLVGVGLAGKAGKVAGLGAKAQAVLDAPNMLMRKALDRGVRLGASATGSVLGATAKVLDAPLKVTSSVLDTSGRVIGRPREVLSKIIAKTTNTDEAFIRNVTGTAGTIYSPAVQAEMLSKAGAGIVKNLPTVLNDAARIFNTLGDTDRQLRFLKEVALDPNISEGTRRLIGIAGNGTQKGLDMAFNAVANGVSAGTLQAIMAKMQTNDPEALGSAFGSGLVFGASIPVGQVPSALGKLVGADADKVFFDTRLKLETARAMETFKKTDPTSVSLMNQLAINGTQAKVHLLHAPEYKAHYKTETGEDIKAGKAVWEDSNGEIYLNVNDKKSAPQLLTTLSGRIAKDALDKDPTLKGRIIKELDPDGVLNPDDVVEKFIQDRFRRFVSGKLDATTITNATSKNLYTLDLLEKTITSVMDKMGLLEVTRTGDMPSVSKKLLSNPYIKNLNDNYNLMKGAIARKRVDMANEGIKRTDAEIARAEAEEKALLQDQVKREVDKEKQDARTQRILDDDAKKKAKEDAILKAKAEKEAEAKVKELQRQYDKGVSAESKRLKTIAKDEAKTENKELSIKKKNLEEAQRLLDKARKDRIDAEDKEIEILNRQVKEEIEWEKALDDIANELYNYQLEAEKGATKVEIKYMNLDAEDKAKVQKELLDRQVKQKQNEIQRQQQEKKLQLTEDKKQLQRDALGHVITLQNQKGSNESANLSKLRKSYNDAVSIQAKSGENKVIQPRVGSNFNTGTTAGANIIMATPTRGYIAGTNPRKALQTMEIAKGNGLPIALDAMTTRAYERVNEGETKKNIIEPEPFITDEFLTIEYLVPKTERADTVLLAQGINVPDAKLFVDRMRNELGIAPDVDIVDKIYQDYKSFDYMNSEIYNNASQLADEKIMDKNLVALMIRANKNKNKLTPDERKLLPFKSFDPNLVVDIKINRDRDINANPVTGNPNLPTQAKQPPPPARR